MQREDATHMYADNVITNLLELLRGKLPHQANT
jgi:hypothetical protein